ncbi:50S ribosomal protein L5 [Candidatus Jorgensenbacteria bacterium]|nr:50S ribosomal protein L5 [Candidatus Jorgensenbacteria bacterium]
MSSNKKYSINSLEKIVVNVGVGKLRNLSQFEEKVLPEITREVSLITGQKPVSRTARQSIAGFKIRSGDVVGLQVTLRRKKKDDFLKKLVYVILPRVKDFRGVSLHNVDERGNLNIGFREQQVFPEIVPEQSRVSFGAQVTLVPVIKNREAAIDFFKGLGVPFKGIERKIKA